MSPHTLPGSLEKLAQQLTEERRQFWYPSPGHDALVVSDCYELCKLNEWTQLVHPARKLESRQNLDMRGAITRDPWYQRSSLEGLRCCYCFDQELAASPQNPAVVLHQCLAWYCSDMNWLTIFKEPQMWSSDHYLWQFNLEHRAASRINARRAYG